MTVEIANVPIQKFQSKGEKTGWTYIEISAEQANQLNPGVKTSYQVKGQLDNIFISGVSMLPMGDGYFIIPLNADLRRKLRKKSGDQISIHLSLDQQGYQLNPDFLEYLETEQKAFKYFNQLPNSHQKYFSKWIDSAKSPSTRANRIAEAVSALNKHWGYAEMIRNRSKEY
ncbi:MAG: DUF1905 domain-containing protein [Saprospiraceae bacterium]|nr:DUF1905 domain-containing protein [Saprospiraceae bacterium]